MVINRWKLISLSILMTLAMVGCGGDDSAQAESPVNPIHTLKLEVLAGQPSMNFDTCQSVDGTADVARFSHLIRATVYKDTVYLAESVEDCANVSYGFSNAFVPSNIRPSIRKLSGNTVETAVALNSSWNDLISVMRPPVMVRYPSGFQRRKNTDEPFVLGYAATTSEKGFVLDEGEVTRYTEQGGWNYYVPGLFRFTQPNAYREDLVAGLPGKPPAYVDGTGLMAGFVAPHDLEMDAAGQFYLIDDGRIRTINEDYEVKTIDHVALGITGAVKALDSDHQGNIHALIQNSGPSYTWHRLADHSQVNFEIREIAQTEPISFETFTVVGNEIVLAVHYASSGDFSNRSSRLYRVSATGAVKELTGATVPATPQDFLDHPSQYLLPPVKHIKYGVDGHLYIVLPQGVLVARNYTLNP
jgi:hypothetical protein